MRNRDLLRGALLLACLGLWVAPVSAQEAEQEMAADAEMEAWMKAGQPGEMHQQLAAFTGEWEAENKFWMDPSAEPMVSKGMIKYEMVMGGRYLKEVVEADFMGQPFKGMGLYGYNNVTGELEAIWTDDMSTGIYTYSGSISEDGKKLTLTGKYKDPASGEWKETRSVTTLESPDKMVYVAYETSDGEEVKMMEITATRKDGMKEGKKEKMKEEGGR